eukprot:m.243377 g.243377  ORF g.243377 m.243377 type:complete len:374 (-) comp14229_c0_seq1:1893-3014(-)
MSSPRSAIWKERGLLAEIKACTRRDGVEEVLFERLFVGIDGQLQQIDAGAGRGQAGLVACARDADAWVDKAEAKQGRPRARRDELDEIVTVLVAHAPHNPPECDDRGVARVVLAAVLAVCLEVLDVDVRLLSGYQQLQLGRAEQPQPRLRDDHEEPVAERAASRADLRVQAVVGHAKDVRDPVGGRDRNVAALWHQVDLAIAPVTVLRAGSECQRELLGIARVVFEEQQIAVQLRVKGAQIIKLGALREQLEEKEGGEGQIEQHAVEDGLAEHHTDEAEVLVRIQARRVRVGVDGVVSRCDEKARLRAECFLEKIGQEFAEETTAVNAGLWALIRMELHSDGGAQARPQTTHVVEGVLVESLAVDRHRRRERK